MSVSTVSSGRPEPRADADALVCMPMTARDLDAVMAEEPTLYTHPWTRGNFADSLHAGYSCWVLKSSSEGGADMAVAPVASVAGYFILMIAVDEAHLLNISVARPMQGRGYGRLLLDKACDVARNHRTLSMILEVRPSNTRALDLYQRYGFMQIGVRRGYYPSGDVDRTRREDAIVMKLVLR